MTFNGEDYIEQCLNSLVSLSYPKWEVIVVDNGSHDASVEIAQAHPLKPRVIALGENTGFAYANNVGIRESQGQLLLLLNQDTEVAPDLLEQLFEAFRGEHNREVGIVGTKVYYPDGMTLQHTGGIIHENALTDHFGAGEVDSGLYERKREVSYVTGAALAFRRELLDHVGELDADYFPAYFEELDFCYQAGRLGFKVVYQPTAQILHYESTSTGKLSPTFYYFYHKNRLRFVRKHFKMRLFWQFVRAEWKWLRTFLPREQVKPLMKAYFYHLAHLRPIRSSRNVR